MNKNSFDDVLFEEVKVLEEGKYKGTITDIQRDVENFDYTRYMVKVEGHELTLNLSFPTKVSFTNDGKPSSQHAKFLTVMGVSFAKDKPISESIAKLVNEQVGFLVQQKTTDRGTFSEIVKDSVKKI